MECEFPNLLRSQNSSPLNLGSIGHVLCHGTTSLVLRPIFFTGCKKSGPGYEASRGTYILMVSRYQENGRI